MPDLPYKSAKAKPVECLLGTDWAIHLLLHVLPPMTTLRLPKPLSQYTELRATKDTWSGAPLLQRSWRHGQYLWLPSSFPNPCVPASSQHHCSCLGDFTRWGDLISHKAVTSFQVNLQTHCNSGSKSHREAFHGTGKLVPKWIQGIPWWSRG